MKVVFVNRFFYPDLSATSQLLTDLACHLASLGVDVHVVTSRLRYDAPAVRLAAQDHVLGVQVHRVWTSRFGRSHLIGRAFDYLTFYASAAFELLRVLSRHDVLVVETDPPLIGLIAVPCARWRGARVIHWIQDLFPEVAQALGLKASRGWFGRLLVRLRNRSLRAADTNVVLGERMAAYLAAHGVPDDRMTLIPNWADGEVIQPMAPSHNLLRAQWGLADAFVVGYSGNLGRAHEFDTVWRAAQALAAHKDIVFMFIGEGQGRAGLEEAVRECGLTQVRFMPYQDRAMLPHSLTAFDAHLVSLRPEMEGLIVPSKLYGALAAGRPVLFLGDVLGEVALVLDRHDCGQAIPIGDSYTLADTILKWRDDQALTRQLGVNARQAFDSSFNKAKALAAWQAVIEREAQGPST